ncbi:MAG: hypothetical protein NT136_04295 [Candidatus Moranbacteria bacterium]|nr:hypothetical protein [Candidatus Moranbacteria bacterium]
MKPKINVGYVSLFLLFITVIFLVWSGFYVWKKYAAPRLPDGEAREEKQNPLSYLSGIKSQISEVQKKQEVKNKRAMELAENTKGVADKSNLYTLEIPESWNVVSNEGAKGTQVSYLVAQSSYFASNESKSNGGNKTFINYDEGAQLTVRITQSEDLSAISGDGGHGAFLLGKKDVTVGGERGAYHVFKESGSPDSQFLDVHLIHKESTYLFRFAYNPKTFSDAEYSFREILDSFKFSQ